MAGLTPEEYAKRASRFSELVLRVRRAMTNPSIDNLPTGGSVISGRLVGEAALEVDEFVAKARREDQNRWSQVCARFPYSACFVDPEEMSFKRERDIAVPIFLKFQTDFDRWIKESFSGRDHEIYMETCSPGVVWTRFVHKADLDRFSSRFIDELTSFKARLEGPHGIKKDLGR